MSALLRYLRFWRYREPRLTRAEVQRLIDIAIERHVRTMHAWSPPKE